MKGKAARALPPLPPPCGEPRAPFFPLPPCGGGSGGGGSTSRAASGRGGGPSKIHKPHLDEMHGRNPCRIDRAGSLPQKPFGEHFDTASRMLGVTENRILGPGDLLLKRGAEAIGVGHTFYPTRVGIFQAPKGEPAGQTYPDPYFGGEGPERTTCNGCGGCMMGCRNGAKNTLDKNYLYLAEKHGAAVFPETKVVDVRPLNGKPDGGDGYEVSTRKSTAFAESPARRFTCRAVVFSASLTGYHRASFPPEVERLPAAHQRPSRQARPHQLRVAHRSSRARQQRRPVEGRGHRLRHLH